MLSRIAYKNHANGAKNPKAQFQKVVSMEKINASPKVAGDLGIMDCSGVSDGSAAAIVLDLPLLFESGWNKFCDKIVFVDSPRALRQSRTAQRGWTEEEFARRETAQQSPEAKRELADVVIDNSGSRESARAQVDRFWQSLVDSSVPR